MLDLSWGELMLVGAVALIVIGPKDLPRTLRTVGNLMGKVKRMASEFQGQFNEAMREADLDQVRRDVEGINRAASAGLNPIKAIRDEVKGAIEKQPASTAAAGSEIASAYQEAKAADSQAPAAEVRVPELPPVGEPVLASQPSRETEQETRTEETKA